MTTSSLRTRSPLLTQMESFPGNMTSRSPSHVPTPKSPTWPWDSRTKTRMPSQRRASVLSPSSLNSLRASGSEHKSPAALTQWRCTSNRWSSCRSRRPPPSPTQSCLWSPAGPLLTTIPTLASATPSSKMGVCEQWKGFCLLADDRKNCLYFPYKL